MANLYITEQGAMIRKTRDQLIVEKDREEILKVPCRDVDSVLLFGNVQFSTQAVAEMLEHGIELALFSSRGRLRGQLTPPKGKNVVLRMAQYPLVADTARRLLLAQEVVKSKILNSRAVLQRYQSNHPGTLPQGSLRDFDRFAALAEVAEDLHQLRGVEGIAAARYFPLLGKSCPLEIPFEGRQRRPPKDPVNALLSFGYVLVGNELESLLDGMGYDPYVGFLHDLDYGRPSLALDMLEEFRAPLVDRLTLRLLNLRILRQEHFESHPRRGTSLNREGLKLYFRTYEEFLTESFDGDAGPVTFRNLFRRQAERYARAIQGRGEYRSFRLPC